MAGVRTARDGTADGDKGKPNTVVSVVDCNWKLVSYFDSKGNPEQALFLVTPDGQYLSTQDTSVWCRSLRTMTDWMTKGVSSILARRQDSQTPVELPKSDSVDVLPEGA
jgi:hypothetical protein